jgi:hypothetical protein
MNSKFCGTCHGTGFVSFAFTGPMNHAGATACATCHTSYVTAVVRDGYTWNPGKANHIATTSQCSACHGTSAWTPANAFDHAANGITAASNCYTGCHDGAHSPAPGRNASHTLAAPMNSQFCGTCHSLGGNFHFTGPMNHTGATACSTCHTSYVTAVVRDGYTWNPGKTNHIVTTSQCSSCHGTNAWVPTTFNHTGVTTASDCYAGCHDGTHGSGTPTGAAKSHSTAPLTSHTCGVCHAIGGTWVGAKMNHTGVAAGTCSTCHNGTAWIGRPLNAIHNYAATQGWPCDRCHTTTAWRPTAFNHTGVTTGSCANCHDGNAATGPTASHPANTVGIGAIYKCDACHRTTAWRPATFAHTGVTTGCVDCHKTGFATPKSAAHFITTVNCEKCHTTTAWAPIKAYVHTSTYYKTHTGLSMTVYADCKMCHINNNEVITGAPYKGSAAYAKDCAWCHSTQFKSGPHKKTTSPTTVYYTVAELKNCSGACHEYSNNTYTTISRNRPGPQHKSTDGGF